MIKKEQEKVTLSAVFQVGFSFISFVYYITYMNITLLTVGNTTDLNISSLVEQYKNRLKHYINFELVEIKDIKSKKKLSPNELSKAEGEQIVKKLKPEDMLFLLDEKGKEFSSLGFADFIQKQMNSGIKNLVFCIGGAYGFSDEIYELAIGKISLSKMTFTHQMVRLFATEQIYRAMTILKGEKYHNE
ncbi:MAG: 23S rRNA (pseudouridine(1915)-N(3))-methyltransferase RlmH [Candidatus Kapaibacteriales bacterium]